jgi:hypothetical protein
MELTCCWSPASAGTILITAQEAGLPAEKITVAQRGISRAPQIEMVEPADAAHSPLHFQVKFRAFGGSKISANTLQLTYLKTPEVDLVPRVTRFVQGSGIDIPDAELPPGDHFFRIAISDTDGRNRSLVFELKVAP